MNNGVNQDLKKQTDALEELLSQNKAVSRILELAPKLNLPNWYIGAGCIAQTVWNLKHGLALTEGIKDCDLVYYNSADISAEAQDIYIQRSKKIFKDITLPIDIVNEARVHLWYEKESGLKIKPYKSSEDAINAWPTTATAVGVRYDKSGRFIVYAPYGLNDLFGLIVRPNKLKITEDIYLAKVERWTKIWPKLKIIPWK